MKNQLEEKELLIMKGEALRMKLLAQAQHTRHTVYQPVLQLKALGSSLSKPALKTLLFTLLNRKLFTARGLTYSALGIAALALLNNKSKSNSQT